MADPVMRMGLIGFKNDAHLVTLLHGHKGLMKWDRGPFVEADALWVNGEHAQLVRQGFVRIPSYDPKRPATLLNLTDLDRPVAFTLPLPSPNIQPPHMFDPGSPESVRAVFKKFEAWLLPLAALLAGGFIDRIDNPRQVNLLSPPLLAFLLWNLGVYLLLSRTGPLGGLGWLFSFKAMVLAQALLVLPVVTALTRQVVEDAERVHGEQLRSLGAGTLLRALLIAWDERYALLTVLIAAFGRAVSEVGAVMIVGGNIDGFTRVMTTAIALETSKGDLPLALALGLVLLSVVLALNVLVGLLRRWRERVDGAASGTPVGVAA